MTSLCASSKIRWCTKRYCQVNTVRARPDDGWFWLQNKSLKSKTKCAIDKSDNLHRSTFSWLDLIYKDFTKWTADLVNITADGLYFSLIGWGPAAANQQQVWQLHVIRPINFLINRSGNRYLLCGALQWVYKNAHLKDRKNKVQVGLLADKVC